MTRPWPTATRPAVRAIVWLRATAVGVPAVAGRTITVGLRPQLLLRPFAGVWTLARRWPRVPAATRWPAQAYAGRPAWYTWAEGCLTPAAWAVGSYRCSHWLWVRGLPSAALALSLPARIGSGADLHPQARIGARFKLAHGFGVVVGETAEIGDDCILLQGVTLGVRHVGECAPPGVRVHPRLGHRVRVGAGAVLLGPITVGDDAQIGANSVVLVDVPAGATAVGVPARLIRARCPEAGELSVATVLAPGRGPRSIAAP